MPAGHVQMMTAGRIFPDSYGNLQRARVGQVPVAHFLARLLISSFLLSCRPAESGAFVFPDASCSKIAKSFTHHPIGPGLSILWEWPANSCQLSRGVVRICSRVGPSGVPPANYFCQHRLKGPGLLRAGAAGDASSREYDETEKFLLEHVGIDCDQLHHLMDATPFPNLRTKSLEREVRPSVRFLVDEAGLTQRGLAKALLTCPQLLGVGVPSLRSGVEFLCELGIPQERIPGVVERFPHILKYSVECNLRPSAQFLRRELHLSEGQLAQIVEQQPACLQLHVERNLLPTCSYFMDRTQMTSKQLGALIHRNPRLLSAAIGKNLEPKFRWISGLGVPQDKVAGLLRSYPLLLSYSLTKLRQAEDVLVQRLKVEPGAVGGILIRCPHLFGLTVEKILANGAYLQQALGLSAPEMADLIKRYPRALTYSRVNNIEPKLTYLRDDMNFTAVESGKEIFEYPLILGYSLEKRIRARHQHLIECDVSVRPRGRMPPRVPSEERPGGEIAEWGARQRVRRRRGRGKAAVDELGVKQKRVISIRSMLSELYRSTAPSLGVWPHFEISPALTLSPADSPALTLSPTNLLAPMHTHAHTNASTIG